jgi:acylphosphatase
MAVATLKEQLEKVASEMKQSTHGYIKNPDGTVDIMVRVSADDVMQLEAWAEGAGESFPEYLKNQVEGAIQSFCNQ